MKLTIANILSVLTKPQKRKLAILIIYNILISILDIISLALLLFIIDFYTVHANHHSFSFLPAAWQSYDSIWLMVVFLFFFILKNGMGYLLIQKQYRFVYTVAADISEKNLLHYLEGTYADHVKIDSAIWIRRISQQPVEFSHYILAGLQQIITESVLIAFTIIAILVFNAKIFLLLLVVLLPAVVLISYFIKLRMQNTRVLVKKASEQTLQYLKEALAGFIESNVYQKHLFFTQRYTGNQKNLNTYLSEIQVMQGVSSRLIEIFAIFGLFLLIAINHLSAGSYVFDMITIGAFMGAAYKIMPGIVKILNANAQMKAYAFTLNDLVVPFVKKDKNVFSKEVGKLEQIRFEQVGFAFHNQQIISGFDLIIQPGDFLCISGDSGKGKTTLVNLLLGFIEPDNGNIYFNGKTVTPAERCFYWPKMAYVKQQTFLLHDTIRTNITLSEETSDTQKLQEAIRLSGLDTLINSFPEGIDKIITENGKNISGGQRQRIAIARALYKNADLFILDEPFNELEPASETELLKHLRQMAATGKMIILITHNRQSLEYCNKIISIDAA